MVITGDGHRNPMCKIGKRTNRGLPRQMYQHKKTPWGAIPKSGKCRKHETPGAYPHRRTLYHRYFNFVKRESQALLQKNENFFAGIYATVTKTLDSSLTREAHHDRIQALMTYSFHGDAQWRIIYTHTNFPITIWHSSKEIPPVGAFIAEKYLILPKSQFGL